MLGFFPPEVKGDTHYNQPVIHCRHDNVPLVERGCFLLCLSRAFVCWRTEDPDEPGSCGEEKEEKDGGGWEGVSSVGSVG